MSWVVQRFFVNAKIAPRGGRGHRAIVARYDTEKEAQAHCQRADTHGGAWCAEHGLVSRGLTSPAEEPPYCPRCGKKTVVAWFDGYTAAGNLL